MGRKQKKHGKNRVFFFVPREGLEPSRDTALSSISYAVDC